MAAEPNKWSRWLSETRFGGDQKLPKHRCEAYPNTESPAEKGGLVEGKIVLDVGAGDGLIGFGAVEKVSGPRDA